MFDDLHVNLLYGLVLAKTHEHVHLQSISYLDTLQSFDFHVDEYPAFGGRLVLLC